jgi:hypothetical protein
VAISRTVSYPHPIDNGVDLDNEEQGRDLDVRFD